MCVLRTNIEEFYGESYIIEIVDHKLKPRRRKKVADAAVSSIGRGGYNIAINNCEHFALSCVYESAKDFDAEDQIKEISNRYRTFEMDVPFIWMPIKSLIMKSTAIYSVVRMRLRQAYHFRKKTLAGQLQAIIEEEVDRLSASTIRDVKVSRFENFFWIVFFCDYFSNIDKFCDRVFFRIASTLIHEFRLSSGKGQNPPPPAHNRPPARRGPVRPAAARG
jgi:hypothetical protein